MSLIDLPTSREYPNAFQQVVPSEDRDFTRSNRGWAAPYPQDANLADDKSLEEKLLEEEEEESSYIKWIKSIQKAMKTSPFSPKYTGEVDGKKTNALVLSVIGFQNGVNNLTGNSFKIVNGNIIKTIPLAKAFKALAKYQKNHPPQKKETEKEEETNADLEPSQSPALVKSYQNFLSKTLPLVGKTYSGPADGQINDNLIAAAKQVEGTIASFINNKSINGMIWSDGSKTFNTSPSDVKEALNLIVEHKNRQKTSNDSSENRILTFSKLLLQNS